MKTERMTFSYKEMCYRQMGEIQDLRDEITALKEDKNMPDGKIEIGEIETGVPIPPVKPNHKKYPFGDMRVNDSVFISGVESKKVCAAASRFGKAWGVKFITRTVHNGVRVWRTA
jgi:hypothetical protein